MFVISRKRIQIILSAILVSVLVLGIQISLKEKEGLTVETTSNLTSDKTIVIDAGHGFPDERSRKQKRHNRSKNKLKHIIKNKRLIRTKRIQSNINTYR